MEAFLIVNSFDCFEQANNPTEKKAKRNESRKDISRSLMSIPQGSNENNDIKINKDLYTLNKDTIELLKSYNSIERKKLLLRETKPAPQKRNVLLVITDKDFYEKKKF